MEEKVEGEHNKQVTQQRRKNFDQYISERRSARTHAVQHHNLRVRHLEPQVVRQRPQLLEQRSSGGGALEALHYAVSSRGNERRDVRGVRATAPRRSGGVGRLSLYVSGGGESVKAREDSRVEGGEEVGVSVEEVEVSVEHFGHSARLEARHCLDLVESHAVPVQPPDYVVDGSGCCVGRRQGGDGGGRVSVRERARGGGV